MQQFYDEHSKQPNKTIELKNKNKKLNDEIEMLKTKILRVKLENEAKVKNVAYTEHTTIDDNKILLKQHCKEIEESEADAE